MAEKFIILFNTLGLLATIRIYLEFGIAMI